MANTNPEISKDKPSEQITPNDIVSAAAQASQKLLQDSNSASNATVSKPASLAHTQQDAAGGTGKATDALQLLTGTTADFTAIQHKQNAIAAMQNQELAQVLSSSSIANKAITASVYGDDTGHTKDVRLLDNHEYTVMNYNPSGADGGTITLRNPLDNQNNGIVQLSFNEFIADFDGISIS